MRNMLKGLIVGIVLTMSIFVTDSSLASGFTKTIEVAFNKVILMVNGTKVKSDNIVYKGTTYIPIKTVIKMLEDQVVMEVDKYTSEVNGVKRPVIDIKITDLDAEPTNPDQEKPTILGITALSGTTVKVTFSERITESTAEIISNYIPTTKFGSNSSLTIIKAELGDDSSSVTLTTNNQVGGKVYNLDIVNVTDIAGNAIEITNLNFAGIAVVPTDPTSMIKISGVIGMDNRTVRIMLSDVVDENTAELAANYFIKESDGTSANSLSITQVELNAEGNVVTLTTSEPMVGIIYTVTLNNIKDGSGKIIKDLSGQFVGNTSPMLELEAVAVFPLTSESIQIFYNMNVDNETAGEVLNYSIYELTNPTLKSNPLNVTVEGDKVLLTTEPLKMGTIYQIKIENVKNTKGGTIVPMTLLFPAP